MTAHVFQEIPVTKQELLNCSYGSWYHKYRKITPKSFVISDLPPAFREYILADGIQMPVDYFEEENDLELLEKRKQRDPTKNFKHIDEKIKQIIKENGPVYPKLNWSAPRDAAWILRNHQVKCESASDIYLILNASSYIVHDLTEALDQCVDVVDAAASHQEISYGLVLRTWFNINPAGEYRCFVKDRKLIGISQRDPNFYDYLAPIANTIKSEIESFFIDNLRDSFANDSFVFDIYFPKVNDKIWLIDINVFSRQTDPLLFAWNELLECPSCELRLVNQYSTAKFASKEHSENYVPLDVVDAGMDVKKMVELMKAYQGEESASDESDEDTQ